MNHIPTYLKEHATFIAENDFLELKIEPKLPHDWFEIFYSGDLIYLENDCLITNEKLAEPILIIAKSHDSNEEIVLFDGALYGYDNMFCYEHDPLFVKNRSLKKYPSEKVRTIELAVGLGIDYESEKEDYSFDSEGNVVLIDDRRVAWEDVKRDGFDFLQIKIITEENQVYEIMSEELS
ncbi:hypothetical protein [Isobaculum melis]|uniref:Uncharacterized protein n=1 Tax=Isobaculum melis TaxID=142588 RepID=A0A1H9TBY6_9LACT|nr:hypothetical protein [Isobaculum melis]SER94722.1 hypothetical protein SAMN04488559_11228 [Isobaculum melis]